jgi:hypothetical protein
LSPRKRGNPTQEMLIALGKKLTTLQTEETNGGGLTMIKG